MGIIEKNDLSLDYDWSSQPGDDPVRKEDIGSNVFDKNRGEDVLAMLNDYAKEKDIQNKDELLDAESMLRNKLPKDLDTKNDVMDWLWSKLRKDQQHA